jgi:hypothetical protein
MIYARACPARPAGASRVPRRPDPRERDRAPMIADAKDALAAERIC